jgi:hypothetical protein
VNEPRTDEVTLTAAPAHADDTTLDVTDRTVSLSPSTRKTWRTDLRIEPNPDAEPHAFEAAVAFINDFDELIARLATHPEETWVAYRGPQRIGFGTDHLNECSAKFPDGLFDVYSIDPILAYPDETVT